MEHSPRKRRLTGWTLVGVGSLFLLVSNDIIIGWGNVWPLFVLASGAVLLRAHRRTSAPEMLFGGIVAVLLGAFFVAFSLGIVPWSAMEAAWPAFPLIAGVAMLAVTVAAGRGTGSLLSGVGVVLFAALGFCYEAGVIGERAAAPFVRFWPLVLVTAGAILLRFSRGSNVDPDMISLRDAMVAGAPQADTAASKVGRNPALDESLDREIVGEIEAARDASAAVRALVTGIKRRTSKASWVGVYRRNGDRLTIADGEFAGTPPDYRDIAFDEGICGAAASNRSTIVVPDVRNDDRYLACSPAVRSEIVIPVQSAGRVVAVLDVDSESVDAFDAADRRRFETLAAALAARWQAEPK